MTEIKNNLLQHNLKSFHIIYKDKHKLTSKNNNVKPVQCFCLNQHRSHGPIFTHSPDTGCQAFLFFLFFNLNSFLGGLSLHLNHLIAECISAPYRQFGTLPIGIFLSNLVSGQLETSLMTSYCHF